MFTQSPNQVGAVRATHFPIKSLTGYRRTAQQEVQRAQLARVVCALKLRGVLAGIVGGSLGEKAQLNL
ncbi:hypothetical protein ASD94_03360 [Acidovorax sp. Root70]|nr:hypothetical protein ASD94_03360 [Acidovorax sp. Root70]